MTQIGSFKRTSTGFEGRLQSLALDAPIVFVRAERGSDERAPDWRIHRDDGLNGPVVGAGWDRVGEKAGPFVWVIIDCPSLSSPIHAHLFPEAGSDELHRLVWTRSEPRRSRA